MVQHFFICYLICMYLWKINFIGGNHIAFMTCTIPQYNFEFNYFMSRIKDRTRSYLRFYCSIQCFILSIRSKRWNSVIEKQGI